jgi:hypothetical protein
MNSSHLIGERRFAKTQNSWRWPCKGEYRGGQIVREGLGLSCFYYSPPTSLVAVPVVSTDTPFIFQETTADFQAVTIQGQVTYRAGEPKRLAALLNFTLAQDGEKYALVPGGEIVSTGYVLHTLHASLWCLLATSRYRECLLRAVNLGDDTDTTGCVAGGLAGVVYGVQSIPADWRNQLGRGPKHEWARKMSALANQSA